MKQIKLLLIALLLLVGITSCGERMTERERWINEQLEQMTVRQQIAQLFVVHFHPPAGEAHVQQRMAEIRDEQVGGVIIGWVEPTQGARYINEMQSQVRVPLLVVMDAEWGISMRVDSVIRFPQQLTLGAIQDLDLIYQTGLEIARQCRIFGVHMNFAPIVDVNNNPHNPIINMRSFGENRYKVTERAREIMRGMHDGGILTALKHFPGHGDTYLDSHLILPTIPHDIERIEEIELFPFRQLIPYATGVMTAHLHVPALCDKGIPVSQSRAVVHDLLVEEMGFQGLIVTDALNMYGATDLLENPNRAALYSLIAGHHILEMPVDVRESITEIENAVNSGEIELELVQNAARKILGAKFDLGLNKGFVPIETNGLLERLNTRAAYALRMRLAEHALTLVANRNDILPLNASENLSKVRHIAIGDGAVFTNRIHEIAEIETVSIMSDFTQAQINAATRNLRNAETIIISYHHTPVRWFTSFEVAETIVNLTQNLARTHNVILVFFGNPYAIASFTQPELFASVIVAYDNSMQSQISSARAVFGQIPFLGKLPITINELFAENDGILMRAQHPDRVMMVP